MSTSWKSCANSMAMIAILRSQIYSYSLTWATLQWAAAPLNSANDVAARFNAAGIFCVYTVLSHFCLCFLQDRLPVYDIIGCQPGLSASEQLSFCCEQWK